MRPDSHVLLELLTGECCDCCDCQDHGRNASSQARETPAAHPLMFAKRMAPLTVTETDTPFVPTIPGDGVQPPVLPLYSSRDGFSPAMPMLPLTAGVWHAPYAAEASPLQEYPLKRLLGTPGANPPGLEDSPRLEHYRTQQRDPLMPYSAGIKNGQVYVRVHDLPSWQHFLRRQPGNIWPDDGVTVWAHDDAPLTAYRLNGVSEIKYTSTIRGGPVIILGSQSTTPSGRKHYYYGLNTETILSGLWRTVWTARLTAIQASVVRHYLNGTTEDEAGLSCTDLTVQAPALGAITRTTMYAAYVEGVGTANFGYEVSGTASPSTDVAGLAFGGSAFYQLISATPIMTEFPPENSRDTLLGGIGRGLDVDAYELPAYSAALGGAAFSPGSLPRTVSLRYINDASGTAVLSSEVFPVGQALAGRVVYEGPLGVLPAPHSGLTSTWCGLDVTASGAFTADAWVNKNTRWAVVLHQSGLIQISSTRQGKLPKVYSFQTGALTAPSLPAGRPILNYRFLQEGASWPSSAGVLTWNDGTQLTHLSVRDRQANDPRDGTSFPLLLRSWVQTPPDTNSREQSARGVLPALPVSASVNPALSPDPLATWQRPAPGEAQGARASLVSVTGTLSLTFAGAGGGSRARLARLAFLTTRSAAKNLSTHLTVPAGWALQIDPRPGRTALVVLTPPTLQALTVSLVCQSLPLGHPRAHLEATNA